MSAEGTSFYDWVTHQRGVGSTPAPEPRRRAIARRVPHLLLLEAVQAPKVFWKQALEPDAVYGVHSAGAAGPALLELALRGSGGR